LNLDWENRYAAVDNLFGASPSTLIQSYAHLMSPGQSVLAIGDGEGRNGVWLAEQGLKVLSVDISPTAQRRARALARQRGVDIEVRCIDLCQWDWPISSFDLITLIFVHFPAATRHQVHQKMIAALKPGGLIMIEAFHIDQLQYGTGGPPDPEMLYCKDILEEDFRDLEVLELKQEVTDVVIAGKPTGQGASLCFVARRSE
jgi:SAM-dependent methyltransferase